MPPSARFVARPRKSPSKKQVPPPEPLNHDHIPTFPIFHAPNSLEKEVEKQVREDEEAKSIGRCHLEISLRTIKDPIWREQLEAAIKTPDLPDWNLMYYENRVAIQKMIEDVWMKKYLVSRITNHKMNSGSDGNPQLVKNVKELVKQLNLKTPIEGRRSILSSMLKNIVNKVGGRVKGSTRREIVTNWSKSIASILEALHRNKLDSDENWNKLLVVVRWIAENKLGLTDSTLFFDGDNITPLLSVHNLFKQMQLQAPHDLICPEVAKDRRKRGENLRYVGPAFVASARFVKAVVRETARGVVNGPMPNMSGF